MITQLSTLKDRLGIAPENTASDFILQRAIEAAGILFNARTGRCLPRMTGAKLEFAADRIEIVLNCYPVESVSAFELKSSESGGWAEITPMPEYLVREGCVLSLASLLGTPRQLARVTWTGGYVMPGSTLQPGQTALPADLEQAAIEHVAAWFLHRDKAGLVRNWPSGGIYQQFILEPLLPGVKAVLEQYERRVHV